MQAAERLDRALDHPAFSPEQLAEWDDKEMFPAEACQVLDDFGLPAYYVPAAHGGKLTDFNELVQLLRTVACRDLTVAVAHGKTFLGAASVWVSGTPEQSKKVSERVRAGDVYSWALTERDHGSDLLAGEVAATKTGGWRLSGEKWLINNATRGQAVCALVRTDPAGGARGHSLFLLDKAGLTDYRHLPKMPTHGIRGADISGIAFDNALVPDDALIGEVGGGVETVLKALQLTRTMCVALSLGAGDHALDLARRFASDRALYDRKLTDLPHVQRILEESEAQLKLAEAVSVMAARGVHEFTSEMSVISAVAKAFVPSVVQRVINRLAELMGLRGFLAGEFAKLDRDHRIVGIFDGSTAVNRHSLITQFPRLARAFRAGKAAERSPFDPANLRLSSPTGCTVVNQVRDGEFGAVVTRVHEEMAKYAPSARGVPASAFALAERYELCFAGAAALYLWQDSDPDAAHACLSHVLGCLR
uniref:Acyl-CoA dehydrogenase, short-chain specific n=1 Tax=uncultured bacterium esnapd2 TaxID=1366601 RepID=S5UAK1_9BACT|nr:acyl-CoA dehydrogenase, short-chain specific [uncultured bacterium esnapd2]